MAECSPDWLATLRKASFRGAHFWVETDSISFGRRIQTHEFPNRDRPFQEDLGEKAIEYRVTAYVASDNVLSEKNALVSACRRRGAGTLVLPTEGSQRVVCFSCTRQHSKDKLGYIAFDIHFGEAGTGFGLLSIGMLAAGVSVAVQSAVPSLVRDFLRSYNVVGEPSWVLPAAVSTFRTWIAAVDDARLTMRTDGTTGAALAASIAAAYADAQTLAYDGRGIGVVAESRIDRQGTEPVGEMVTVIANVVADFRLAAITPEEAIDPLLSLVEFDVPSPVAGEGITAKVEATNDRAIASVVRRAALLELSVAAAEAVFPDRRTAIRVRSRLSQGFERELSTATGETFQALDNVRGKAADAISKKVADLRPSIVVEANASLPSLVWAYRLYADAGRADEIAQRNRVRHPAFMPPQFEAEAPENSDV